MSHWFDVGLQANKEMNMDRYGQDDPSVAEWIEWLENLAQHELQALAEAIKHVVPPKISQTELRLRAEIKQLKDYQRRHPIKKGPGPRMRRSPSCE